jgi:carbon storage regulator CsrA
MLVLSRSPGGSVIIGGTIQVKVANIDRGKVRLVITGPNLFVDKWYKKNDRINLTDTISIFTISVTRSWARLGFDAPRMITIHRLEIQNRVDAGKKQPRTLAEFNLVRKLQSQSRLN